MLQKQTYLCLNDGLVRLAKGKAREVAGHWLAQRESHIETRLSRMLQHRSNDVTGDPAQDTFVLREDE